MSPPGFPSPVCGPADAARGGWSKAFSAGIALPKMISVCCSACGGAVGEPRIFPKSPSLLLRVPGMTDYFWKRLYQSWVNVS